MVFLSRKRPLPLPTGTPTLPLMAYQTASQTLAGRAPESLVEQLVKSSVANLWPWRDAPGVAVAAGGRSDAAGRV